jgi:NAD(P)-dependent dehydrogenase (short-subunit alcohol dehydrogenase family)
VAATSRGKAGLKEGFGDEGDFLGLEADLTDEHSVKRAIDATVERFGAIDVVVNNAGYGLHGTVEALSDAEYRRNFDVNVFAPLNVLRHALPYLRQQRSGHVVNIASIVGFQGAYAGWSGYAATKFALAGLTEALSAEAAEVGIKATVVYPGPVRTDFLASGSLAVAERTIDDYTEAQASIDLHKDHLDGNQAGDPEKVVQLIIDAVNSSEPPLHLFAGKIANQLGDEKIDGVRKDLDAWRAASAATDFPDGQ